MCGPVPDRLLVAQPEHMLPMLVQSQQSPPAAGPPCRIAVPYGSEMAGGISRTNATRAVAASGGHGTARRSIVSSLPREVPVRRSAQGRPPQQRCSMAGAFSQGRRVADSSHGDDATSLPVPLALYILRCWWRSGRGQHRPHAACPGLISPTRKRTRAHSAKIACGWGMG